MKLKAPEGFGSAKIGGKEITAIDGIIETDDGGVAHALREHGCTPITEGASPAPEVDPDKDAAIDELDREGLKALVAELEITIPGTSSDADFRKAIRKEIKRRARSEE